MKFSNIGFFLTIFCLSCLLLVHAQDDSAAKRPGILLRRPGARPGNPGKPSTTPPAPKENDEEYPDEQYDEQSGDEGGQQNENDASSTTTTSTEPPKKIGPIIRPFRSNDDLLSALKRRQQNSKKGVYKVEKPISKPINKQEDDEEESDKQEPAPVVSKPTAGRRNKFAKSLKSKSDAPAPSDDVESVSSPVVKRPARFNLKTRLNN